MIESRMRWQCHCSLAGKKTETRKTNWICFSSHFPLWLLFACTRNASVNWFKNLFLYRKIFMRFALRANHTLSWSIAVCNLRPTALKRFYNDRKRNIAIHKSIKVCNFHRTKRNNKNFNKSICSGFHSNPFHSGTAEQTIIIIFNYRPVDWRKFISVFCCCCRRFNRTARKFIFNWVLWNFERKIIIILLSSKQRICSIWSLNASTKILMKYNRNGFLSENHAIFANSYSGHVSAQMSNEWCYTYLLYELSIEYEFEMCE